MKRRSQGLAFALVVVVSALLAVVQAPAQAVQSRHDRIVSAVPSASTPHVLDGRVLAVVEAGDLMVLGGRFSQVSSPDGQTTYNRDNLVAFDKHTGQVSTAFAPHTDGDVEALVVSADGNSVYVGGRFDTIDGQGPRTLARLSLSDGTPVPGFTAPSLNGRINDLKLSDGRLWIAGNFGYVADRLQPALATLNAATGAFDSFTRVQFAEPREEGQGLQVLKFDITPDGDRLVAIGNFTTIDGQSRYQAGVLDLSGPSATVADWQTQFFTTACSGAFDSYMRDVDFSPDGAYFVIVTTGSYGGGPPGACDTSSRFETSATGQAIQPTWVEYTGGDTTLSVAVTGAAVYTGGHFRWQNNPYAGDQAGRGAVDRPGLASLDPVNGVPYTWNPTRTLGVGVFDILATDEGIWVASDTDRIGDWLYRGRIAFFPLTGGTEVAAPYPGELPGTLYTAPAGTTSVLRQRSFDGTTLGEPSDAGTGGIAWQNTRGAFMLNGTLYTGQSDGAFVRRTYDGTQFGTAVTINVADQLVADTIWHSHIQTANGMFYSNGRIYYARTSTNQLLYRNFNVQSDVVDPRAVVADTGTAGIDWRQARGMVLAGDTLYFGYSGFPAGLRKVHFADGQVTGPVEIVSTEGDWNNRSMFLYAGVPNQPPVATFTVACEDLTCSVDGSGSSDPDGSIAGYEWTFGDGGTATGATASHTYDAEGNYDITLTVTDNSGRATQDVEPVEVAAPLQGVTFVGAAATNANAQSFQAKVPDVVQAGDRMLLFLTLNATDRTITPPAGWTLLGAEPTSSATTSVWQKQATASDAGSQVGVGVSAFTKGALTVVAYRGPNLVVRAWDSAPEATARTTHTTPALAGVSGARLVSYWGEKSSGTTSWTMPAGNTKQSETFGEGGGRIASLLAESDALAGTGTVGGLAATTNYASAQASMWSILVGPAQ
ncbi:PKD domain-containing protein [Flindersiella endophytica]